MENSTIVPIKQRLTFLLGAAMLLVVLLFSARKPYTLGSSEVPTKLENSVTAVRVSSHQQRHPRLLLLTILLAGLILLGNVAAIQLITDEYRKLVFIDVTYPLWDLWAMLGLGYAAWRSMQRSRRLALAWGCLAAAACSSGIGSIVWALLELGQGSVPFPSAADLFYLAMYPLFLCGVLLLPTKYSHSIEWLKVIIDMAIVLITATLLFWHFIIGTVMATVTATMTPTMTDMRTVEQIVALAYPVGDMVLLWAILVLLYRGANGQRMGPLLLLIGATGITVVADTIYSTQMLLETYVSAGILDISWILKSLLYGIAGVWQATAGIPTTPSQSSRLALRLKNWLSYLPYFCAISAYLLLEMNHSQGKQIGVMWQTWGVGLIVILVISRLLVNRWENRRQAQTLQQINLALQEEISERKRKELQIQHYVHTLEALHQIHLSLAAELDMERLAQLITDVATDLSGAEFGAFFYQQQSQTGGNQLLYSLSGVEYEAFAHFPIPPNTHIFGPMLRGVRSIRMADVTQDPSYGHNLQGVSYHPATCLCAAI